MWCVACSKLYIVKIMYIGGYYESGKVLCHNYSLQTIL